ncbi:hypothetical protein GGX14DRAFT_400637 [Mycena pura]|uniref:Uncharacterized protein n=1 Tax=Mycena pura TaxID=153505 RepID=A0AAD6V5Z5_9AGAR|nr:hypothetical protein GGX14DRAFT_400637 [Mycena pura]
MDSSTGGGERRRAACNERTAEYRWNTAQCALCRQTAGGVAGPGAGPVQRAGKGMRRMTDEGGGRVPLGNAADAGGGMRLTGDRQREADCTRTWQRKRVAGIRRWTAGTGERRARAVGTPGVPRRTRGGKVMERIWTAVLGAAGRRCGRRAQGAGGAQRDARAVYRQTAGGARALCNARASQRAASRREAGDRQPAASGVRRAASNMKPGRGRGMGDGSCALRVRPAGRRKRKESGGQRADSECACACAVWAVQWERVRSWRRARARHDLRDERMQQAGGGVWAAWGRRRGMREASDGQQAAGGVGSWRRERVAGDGWRVASERREQQAAGGSGRAGRAASLSRHGQRAAISLGQALHLARREYEAGNGERRLAASGRRKWAVESSDRRAANGGKPAAEAAGGCGRRTENGKCGSGNGYGKRAGSEWREAGNGQQVVGWGGVATGNSGRRAAGGEQGVSGAGSGHCGRVRRAASGSCVSRLARVLGGAVSSLTPMEVATVMCVGAGDRGLGGSGSYWSSKCPAETPTDRLPPPQAIPNIVGIRGFQVRIRFVSSSAAHQISGGRIQVSGYMSVVFFITYCNGPDPLVAASGDPLESSTANVGDDSWVHAYTVPAVLQGPKAAGCNFFPAVVTAYEVADKRKSAFSEASTPTCGSHSRRRLPRRHRRSVLWSLSYPAITPKCGFRKRFTRMLGAMLSMRLGVAVAALTRARRRGRCKSPFSIHPGTLSPPFSIAFLDPAKHANIFVFQLTIADDYNLNGSNLGCERRAPALGEAYHPRALCSSGNESLPSRQQSRDWTSPGAVVKQLQTGHYGGLCARGLRFFIVDLVPLPVETNEHSYSTNFNDSLVIFQTFLNSLHLSYSGPDELMDVDQTGPFTAGLAVYVSEQRQGTHSSAQPAEAVDAVYQDPGGGMQKHAKTCYAPGQDVDDDNEQPPPALHQRQDSPSIPETPVIVALQQLRFCCYSFISQLQTTCLCSRRAQREHRRFTCTKNDRYHQFIPDAWWPERRRLADILTYRAHVLNMCSQCIRNAGVRGGRIVDDGVRATWASMVGRERCATCCVPSLRLVQRVGYMRHLARPGNS